MRELALTMGGRLSMHDLSLIANATRRPGEITGLPLLRVALPFFVGRTVSYAAFTMSGAAVGRHLHVESLESTLYASVYFIASQALLIGALYAFTKIDWRALLDQHKLVWLKSC